MTSHRPALSSMLLAVSIGLAIGSVSTANADETAAAAGATKSRSCLVLPRAQLGQGSSGDDVGEPVRQTLISYLNGPTADLIQLQARIPMQIEVEAQQAGCE